MKTESKVNIASILIIGGGVILGAVLFLLTPISWLSWIPGWSPTLGPILRDIMGWGSIGIVLIVLLVENLKSLKNSLKEVS